MRQKSRGPRGSLCCNPTRDISVCSLQIYRMDGSVWAELTNGVNLGDRRRDCLKSFVMLAGIECIHEIKLNDDLKGFRLSRKSQVAWATTSTP